MGRENKKEAVAALHRAQILKAAEKLFLEKGYAQTTIEDISKASGYSRRTIYAYYESKDDISQHMIEQGLLQLKQDIENAIELKEDFISVYKAICMAMASYQRDYHHSADRVDRVNAASLELESPSHTVKRILLLGTELNALLAAFIETGKQQGVVRQDIIPMLSVYILWSSITSFLALAQTKGSFISKQLSMSEDELFDYGFKQLINSILEVRI